ncbi:ArsA-related P-loop ATPase, partial [Noviherbaspirillum sp.]|uniref:ArsA-related P-loop ATPase n=1 Tax=Noviherbaspirillum sp. TaxID=1926288 RepID=UPI002FE40E9C
IREAGKKFVVMDTAPTGHTLLLLDATGAYHRDISRQLSDKGMHFITPMMQLQDGKQTKVLIVTLAETTPVLEAANLQEDLRRAGIDPWAWIINNSLAAAQPASGLLRQRAAGELAQVDAVATHHARRWAIVPLQAREPIGVERLLSLTTHNSGTPLAETPNRPPPCVDIVQLMRHPVNRQSACDIEHARLAVSNLSLPNAVLSAHSRLSIA